MAHASRQVRAWQRLALVLSLAVGAQGCGPPATRIEEAHFSPSLNVDLSASRRLGRGVWVRDLVRKPDASQPKYNQSSTQFTGWLIDGTEVHTGAVTFTLSRGAVIEGYELGVADLRVDDERQLIIPPELAYGEAGYGPVPPNAILVYVVKAVYGP
jgi:FKBP-type peptidyl-prolyl cis-trans isomerase